MHRPPNSRLPLARAILVALAAAALLLHLAPATRATTHTATDPTNTTTTAPVHRAPLIAINVDIPSSATADTSLQIRSTYVDAVTSAGGVPILVPPVLDPSVIRRYVELADGFVFVGGKDVNPARFGAEAHPAWNPLNERREEFDFALMGEALDSGKPVLGVCLGMQQLHIHAGGSMIQDIPSETTTTINHRPGGGTTLAHDVLVEPGTLLHRLLGTERLAVNSIHHQACILPATTATVSARAPDGTIEAIELTEHAFALGVQWHPEFLSHDATHLGIFRGLIDAARAKD